MSGACRIAVWPRALVVALLTALATLPAGVQTDVLGNWYGGLGNTRLHMVAGLVAMVINVFLNWVLIYGNLGAPALGAHGAALASVIATWIGFAVVFTAFLLRIAVPCDSVQPRALRLAELGRMVRFGLPNGLNWFLEFSAFALFINVVVAQLGTTVLAAMMVVININEVAFMVKVHLVNIELTVLVIAKKVLYSRVVLM